MNIEEKAHEYLINKGCLSIGQTYTAYQVEKMLIDFVNKNTEKNKLICIGYTGIMKCYLNISEKEAIQRYIKDENISETQMEMDNDIQINHIEFSDEFSAYSVW